MLLVKFEVSMAKEFNYKLEIKLVLGMEKLLIKLSKLSNLKSLWGLVAA